MKRAEVLVEYKENALYLSLSHAETLNALTPALADELIHILSTLSTNADVRAVVLRGEGRFFSSGQNLKMQQESCSTSPIDMLEKHYNVLMLSLKKLSVPLVVALNGPAVGIAVGIALLGDVVLASESSYISLPFSKLGLVPDGGSSWLLARQLGKVLAADMYYSGRRMDSAEMLQRGLVAKVYPDSIFLERVSAYVSLITKNTKGSNALVRELFWQASINDFEEQLQEEAKAQKLCLTSSSFYKCLVESGFCKKKI